MSSTLWTSPPASPQLAANEVHVYVASLEPPPERVHELAQALAEDEALRAGRFAFERGRRRYIVARGLLRLLLGRYLAASPEALRFDYGPKGKPSLAEPFNSQSIHFSLAHSHELALFAFTCGREVGVDVEASRPVPEASLIAARFFSPAENAVFQATPFSGQQEAFFNCWTRKEAYIKALGGGLTQPLEQFSVSLAAGEPARLLAVTGQPEEAGRWSMQALAPAPGYVGALVVEGQGWELSCWRI